MTWLNILTKNKLLNFLTDVQYRFNWNIPKKGSVKNFLCDNVYMAIVLTEDGELPKFKGSNDEKIVKIQKWVIENIKYVPDVKRWNSTEYWQSIEETINFKTGDCEDGAILIYAMARANGISPAQLSFVCGNVKYDKSTVGHAWVEYASDIMSNDYSYYDIIDWCYYINTQPIGKRINLFTSYYLTNWFRINDFEVENC